MLCYKDRTYCPFYTTCKHGMTCPDALTDAVVSAATSAKLYVSQLLHRPECYKEEMDDH